MAQMVGAFAAASVVLSGRGGSSGGSDAPGMKSIAELVEATKNLSTFVTAMSAANISSIAEFAEVTEATEEFTVFAPTNNAFDKVDETLLGCLLAPVGRASLTKMLKYHVVNSSALAVNLTDNEELTTLEGQELKVSKAKNKLMVGDATIVQADFMANNGVVHEIDAVLVPAEVLEHPPQCGTGTIAQTAVAMNNPEALLLTTLVTAWTATDLVKAVNSTMGDLLTVFAPSDQAFAALPKGMWTCLLKPANKDALASILELHVVPQYLLAAHVGGGDKVDTLLKDNQLTFAQESPRGNWHITLNAKATVIQADIFATNGVVHVIDAVLLPATNWTNPCASVDHGNEIHV